jgi:hypothetical protein
MDKVNFSPKLAGSLISILPRNAAAKTFENRSNEGVSLGMSTKQVIYTRGLTHFDRQQNRF